MKPWDIVAKLFTEKNSTWMIQLDDIEVQPIIINRYIGLIPKFRNHARILDKYVFTIPPKMWLSLAWSALPKFSKAPYIQYISKKKEDTEFDFILDRIRKHFKMSDNDYNANKSRLLTYIKNDKSAWFKFYGIEKTHWKRYRIDFKQMSDSDEPTRRNVTLGDFQ